MTPHSIVQSVKLGFTWCYLLKGRDGYLLIDTSYPGYFPRFRKSIAKLGIDVSEIKYLLVTHHHDDHAGFAAELVEKTGCRVIAHQNAVAPLKQGESERKSSVSYGKINPGKKYHRIRNIIWNIDSLLSK